MKYAILGDLHANRSALEAVLASIEPHGVDTILSVGDLVGYGPSPREVIDLVREAGIVAVRGRHDEACAGLLEPTFFTESGRRAALWTRDLLSEGDRNYLRSLPLTRDLEGCSLAYSTYAQPGEARTITTLRDAEPCLEAIPYRVAFVGQTHVPLAMVRERAAPHRASLSASSDLDLLDVHRALINPGSVGQPRDEDPRAPFGLFDTETLRYRLLRCEYDVERERRRFERAGVPSFLGERLALGV